jgi:hypothetical protein
VTFREAVEAAPAPANAAYCQGKQALKGEHREQVDCADGRRFTGSIDLDKALELVCPGDRRWDYGVGFRERTGAESAVWVEVHPATAGEVDRVLIKQGWLLCWLRTEAPDLAALTKRRVNGKAFFWVATGSGVHIRKGSRQAIRLQNAGFDLPRQRIVLS